MTLGIEMNHKSFQVLIVGSGVAGLTAAIHLAKANVDVAIMTKDALPDSATNIAQGGIAAVLYPNGDSAQQHLSDTLLAGAGLCDREATELLVNQGPLRVRELIEAGANFDVDVSGNLMKGREGGHSFARVVHAGGAATGAEVERTLLDSLYNLNVTVLENTLGVDLIKQDGKVTGVKALGPHGEQLEVKTDFVILATGGASQLFPLTTSPLQSTGDGLAMALRAKVACGDLEFVQFHPTALAIGASPRTLLSEAIRGEGALLLDRHGRRFVDELLPRDIVSRKMAEKMAEEQSSELFLDTRGIPDFASKFPNIFLSLQALGLDPTKDLLPVAPAAHYLCGGILVDTDGFSATEGLCAIGEVACNGVHGANRLASNSLLDGLVSGKRVAERIISGSQKPTLSGALAGEMFGFDYFAESLSGKGLTNPEVIPDHIPLVYLDRKENQLLSKPDPSRPSATLKAFECLQTLRQIAGKYLAMSRSETGLKEAAKELDDLESVTPTTYERANVEVSNLQLIARAVLFAADVRLESRGAHIRSEFSGQNEKYMVRFIHGSKDVLPRS